MSTSGGRIVVNPDDEFGVVAVPSVGVEGSKGKGNTLKDLDFLNYVTCSLCGFPFYSKTEENRKFWMTSCGHMLCGTREHNHQKGRCTRCKKEDIDVFQIDENLDPRLREWFGSSGDDHAHTLAVLKRTVAELETGPLAVASFHNAELLRLVKLLRVNDERKEENIKIVKAELLKMGAMKKEISAMKAEIAELKKENADLKAGRAVYPHAVPPPTHYGAVNSLTPVAEEDNEEGYSDSGPQSIRRFELDLASGSGRHNGSNRFTTPRAMPSRITLPPTDRPATTEPYHDPRATRSVPRTNLEKFRMSEAQPRTPNAFHPYPRPGSARPYAHSRDHVGSTQKRPQEYPNSFMEGLPVNGQANTFAPTGGPPNLQQEYSAQPFQATPQYDQYGAQQDDVNY